MYTSKVRVLLLVGTLLFAAQSTRRSNAQVAQQKLDG
jgi:hypothetical protein